MTTFAELPVGAYFIPIGKGEQSIFQKKGSDIAHGVPAAPFSIVKPSSDIPRYFRPDDTVQEANARSF